ncbi:MAG: NDP-sugar synthase, partial [Actinomycetes bacterium]
MKAIVLIGGQGTRLRPLTYTTTKAMLPIVNQPFLDRLIRRLEANDVSNIVFAINYLANDLQAYLEQQKKNYKAKITCSIEPQPLGSGGALKYNAEYLEETFLLLNGDILTDLDYKKMVRFHKEKNAQVTVNIAQVSDPTRFGVIDTDSQDRVISWQEKPSIEEARSNWVNVGVWVIDPSVLLEIPSNRFVSLEREVFQSMVGTKSPFYAFKSHGYWADIGTPSSYAQIHKDILFGKIEEPILGVRDHRHNVWAVTSDIISPAVSIFGPAAFGEDIYMGNGVSITGPSVFGARCKIAPNASIADSILWDDVEVGEEAIIKNSIIGRNVRLAPKVRISNSVIADDVFIDVPELDSAQIGPGTSLSHKSLIHSALQQNLWVDSGSGSFPRV